MIFTSFHFVFAFLLVAGGRRFLRHATVDKWFLLVASLCFYLSWSIPGVLLVLFLSGVDYHTGQAMGRTADPTRRKRLLMLSLLADLGSLAFFKYTNFLLDTVWWALNNAGWPMNRIHCDIALPPAISYFTFTSMAYVIDVYYERSPPCRNLRDYSLFITFFPKLLAGPIVRAGDFLPQLGLRGRARAIDIETGLAYFLLGAVKKLVISDQISAHINLIFSAPAQYDGFTLLQGLLGYAVQIYCDFSGYSDMAIGCARVLGFRLPENFRMPYGAVTISEFWRRWHITLSEWFRDYVFLPREMATRHYRSPTLRCAVNLVLTMLLCGLWHGASWSFVFWGGIHGLSMAVHKAWTVWNPLASLLKHRGCRFLWTALSRLLTLSVVVLAWVFFRAESFRGAGVYLVRMLSWSLEGTRLVSPHILASVAAVAFTHLVVAKDRNWPEEMPQKSMLARSLAYTCLVLLLVCLGATDAAPFIYAQF